MKCWKVYYITPTQKLLKQLVNFLKILLIKIGCITLPRKFQWLNWLHIYHFYITVAYSSKTISTQIPFGKNRSAIYGATMPRKRFPFLLKHLAFDDAETRQERSQKDQFAAFRGFFESFHLQCQKTLVTNFYLALDEKLYPLRIQVSF